MAVARSHASKAPSQDPADFYVANQQGGCYGKPSRVAEKFNENPAGIREQIMGRPTLGRSGDGTETDQKRQPSAKNQGGQAPVRTNTPNLKKR